MRALVLVVLLLGACAQAPRDEPSGPVVTHVSARAWLDNVRGVHEAADSATTAEARAIALDGLRMLADRAVPDGVPAADAASMRRDLYGRAARLALLLERFTDAEALIERGLDIEDTGRDPFHTQLLLLSVETQRALGNEAAAREAERRARAELTR